MTRRVLSMLVTVAASAVFLLALASTAAADHTDPSSPESQPTSAPTHDGQARGEGEW
jgi:hypothetical protein